MRTAVRNEHIIPAGPDAAVGVVIALADALRAVGLPVSTSETIDAVGALAVVDAGHREVTRAALRAALLKDTVGRELFDRLFDELFPAPSVQMAGDREADPGNGAAAPPAGAGTPPRTGPSNDALIEALRSADESALRTELAEAVDRWAGITGSPATEGHHVQRVLRRLDLDRLFRSLLAGRPDRTPLERQLDLASANAAIEQVRELLRETVRSRLAEVGPVEMPTRSADLLDLTDMPLLRATPDQLAALRGTLRPLARRIATRLGRRRQRARGQLDMRRTIRASMSSGGVPLTPRLRRRHPTRPDLVVLCDVSGSVAQFVPFTLALLHALHAEFGRVRSWVFIDGVVEVTGHLAAAPGVIDVHHLLARRGLVAGDGRSDYRAALARFLDRWPDAVTGRTTVLVIGDARHHDREPAFAELARLHRLGRRVYWFNPEPSREWDTADSAMSGYAAQSTRVFEVSTLRQLGEAVTAIG